MNEDTIHEEIKKVLEDYQRRAGVKVKSIYLDWARGMSSSHIIEVVVTELKNP